MALYSKTNSLYDEEGNPALLTDLASKVPFPLLIAIQGIEISARNRLISLYLAHSQADSFHLVLATLQRLRQYLKALKSNYAAR